MKLTKKLLIYPLATGISLLTSCGGGTQTSADSKMADVAGEMAGMKTIVVEYKTSVNAPEMKSSSVMTQYMDIEHDRHAVYTQSESEMMGVKNTDNSLLIAKDGWSYLINLTDKTGYKSKDMEAGEDPADRIKPVEDDVTFRQMVENEGGKIVGNESFLGRDCIVAEMTEQGDEGETMTTRVWYYKGIPLKMTNDFYTMEATKFEENVSIPDSRFEIPEDIKLSEMPPMP